MKIITVNFDKDALHITLADGREISAPLEWFPRLRDATEAERNEWRLIGNGGYSSCLEMRTSGGHFCAILAFPLLAIVNTITRIGKTKLTTKLFARRFAFQDTMSIGIHWPKVDEDIAVSTLMRGYD